MLTKGRSARHEFDMATNLEDSINGDLRLQYQAEHLANCDTCAQHYKKVPDDHPEILKKVYSELLDNTDVCCIAKAHTLQTSEDMAFMKKILRLYGSQILDFWKSCSAK
jgi:hypothetical protein